MQHRGEIGCNYRHRPVSRPERLRTRNDLEQAKWCQELEEVRQGDPIALVVRVLPLRHAEESRQVGKVLSPPTGVLPLPSTTALDGALRRGLLGAHLAERVRGLRYHSDGEERHRAIGARCAVHAVPATLSQYVWNLHALLRTMAFACHEEQGKYVENESPRPRFCNVTPEGHFVPPPLLNARTSRMVRKKPAIFCFLSGYQYLGQ